MLARKLYHVIVTVGLGGEFAPKLEAPPVGTKGVEQRLDLVDVLEEEKRLESQEEHGRHPWLQRLPVPFYLTLPLCRVPRARQQQSRLNRLVSCSPQVDPSESPIRPIT
jgi:hypothetical protein